MSSIEERLAADIEAVTGGVVVTETDLRDARESVTEYLDNRRQSDRGRTIRAAAVAAVLIPVLGVIAFQSLGSDDETAPANPGPTTPLDVDERFLAGDAPTPQLVDGLWRVDNGTALMLFGEDGTLRVDSSGAVFSRPAVTGTYEIDGDLITVTTTGAQPKCIGKEFEMRASLPGLGAMRIIHTQSPSGNCALMNQGERLVLEQVLPVNNEFLRRFRVPQKGDWQPPAGPGSLWGVWMADATADGGGHVLELVVDGYVVADESGDVVDQGDWSLSGSSARLTLVSEGGSPTCDPGDRLVLAGVELMDSGTALMRGTVEQNTCRGAWAPARWILIPHEGS